MGTASQGGYGCASEAEVVRILERVDQGAGERFVLGFGDAVPSFADGLHEPRGAVFSASPLQASQPLDGGGRVHGPGDGGEVLQLSDARSGEVERRPREVSPSRCADSHAWRVVSSRHRTPAEMTLLQELPPDFTFVQSSYQSQVQLRGAVQDDAGDGTNALSLRPNEVAVMALNEVAVARGRGFFWHLPSRDRLKNDRSTTNHGKQGKGKRAGDAAVPQDTPPDRMAGPAQRVLPLWPDPAHADGRRRPNFPTMMYLDHAWSDAARERFRKTPHRARYLLCDGLLNPPARGAAPAIHRIQYASHTRYQLFATDQPSLVVLQTHKAFYAMSTDDLDMLRGRTKHNGVQFSQTSKLWDDDEHLVERFTCPDAQALYAQLTSLCMAGRSAPVTAGELSRYTPRPAALPAPAQLLGTVPLGSEGNNRSGPKSSKGCIRQRARKSGGPSEEPVDELGGI
ncbi:uncharacterized protein N0V89_007612 [Didymosphaeria variabile]|uniref:Uncharacterized protein n=1 Tax=Didymosphaeria variabile TaxID=1932322 RepID=A0A9W8XLU4_9PLEO|nr:uncharacterized protein N0V89_007612 [Didymosphaeria variabile]KAJ4352265.1 hypothetical protein N0V89_007612 [Didymosphaeria variabile]